MKKIIAVVLLVAFVLFLLWLQGMERLWLIRVTVHSSLPEWAKALLWGWF